MKLDLDKLFTVCNQKYNDIRMIDIQRREYN